MPAIEITNAKGLVQKTGSGVTSSSTVSLTNTLNATGVSNVNRSAKSSDRYYLEEYFAQRPALNADLDSGGTTTTAAELTKVIVANKSFEILGTNASTDDVTFSATHGGLQLQTDTGDADQIIILPHLDTNQSAWSGTKWGTENYTEWECSITTSAAIDNQKIWAGLKLTNDQLSATDDNEIFFKASTDATVGEVTATSDNLAQDANGTNMTWHIIYSIAGVDFDTNTDLVLAANTNYHLKIVIDSERRASAYINGTQYPLVNDTGHTGGNSGTTATHGETDTLVNGASGGATTTIPHTLVVDGVDARKTFKVGDHLHVTGTAVAIGKVTAVTELGITVDALLATIANDTELFNFGQRAQAGATEKRSKALADNIDLIPYIGIENGDGAAAILLVHYTAINRVIFE